MPIKYSLTTRSTNPSKENSPKKVYPTAQYSELVELGEFAKHVHDHGSPYTRDVIAGVLTAAVDCLREQLVAGRKVSLGELGSFHVVLHSDGAESPEYFDPNAHVSRIEVRWTPTKTFYDLKGDPGVKWEYTLTHRGMAEAKKQAQQEMIDDLEGSDGEAGKPGGPSTVPDGGMDE